ncbi:MAG: ATP-binding cassette domain-containing protein [Clostridia bacterium]|nr:ATP-binding cassette domain-containing protein [Clostridia bacterium]
MLLKIENASFSYNKEKKVIDNLSFTASKGDLIAILGPNGAGKTTMLRCMMGFLKFNKGTSELCGESIYKMTARRLWSKISYVPQAKGVATSLTAEDCILLGLSSKIGVFASPTELHREKVREVCRELSIEYLLDKRCNQMSGGELQMVLIARALISEPEIIILDEPESNLDFRNQLIVLNTLSRLASGGMCVIFNTHYPEHALTRANKSLILHKGGKTIFGETQSVVTEENIRNAFGVNTVISEVETTGNTFKSIMPVELTDKRSVETKAEGDDEVIGIVSVIFSDYTLGARINEILSGYSKYIIGRMGMPYKKGGVYIINVTLDATLSEVEALRHKLYILPGVKVKSTVAGKNTDDNGSDEII